MMGEMLNWWSKSNGSSEEAKGSLDLEEIKKQDRAILFKHSRTCHISWAAQSEVKRFSQQHPEIPVYTLIVQDDRELSRQVAEWTGIAHQSPQVFVLQQGKVIASDSHEGVNAEFLAESIPASGT